MDDVGMKGELRSHSQSENIASGATGDSVTCFAILCHGHGGMIITQQPMS